METKGLWQAVLGEFEVKISRAVFATWFKNTSILSNEGGKVIIAVPSIMNKEWLEDKYHSDIKTILSKVAGNVRTIEYKVVPPSQLKSVAHSSVQPSLLDSRPSDNLSTRYSPSLPIRQPVSNLKAHYTFDTFVVGSSNELAYAACQAVAKYSGTKYNPLLIYGGVGLGKTHLMHAIGNEIQRQDSSKVVEYVTSESYTNELVSSISRKKTHDFADKYRNVDVLIVDDIQFIAGKEKTQEEFFHTFNALHHANKQIILSSDRPPKAIATLEERLRSRFEWGMIADVSSPDLETRLAILQDKISRQGVYIPAEVIQYLGTHVKSNIRELEGALTQLIAQCEFRNIEPSVAAAANMIGGLASTRAKTKAITPKNIIEKVAAYFDLSTADILSAKRDKEIVVPRQIAMYLMRKELDISFPKIASVTGRKDHTTAMHSVSKIEKQIEVDEDLRQQVGSIKERLFV